jgi:hypothetical protein
VARGVFGCDLPFDVALLFVGAVGCDYPAER